jgi:hypothetical protein
MMADRKRPYNAAGMFSRELKVHVRMLEASGLTPQQIVDETWQTFPDLKNFSQKHVKKILNPPPVRRDGVPERPISLAGPDWAVPKGYVKK